MTSSQSPTRKIALLVAALSILAIGLAPTSAGAQSTKDRLNAQRERVSALKSRAGQIASAYADTEHELEETRGEIAQTQARKRQAEADMVELRDRLKSRVRAAYRNRGVGFFQFLLEAESFRDFNLRLMSLQRQTLNDEDLILQLRKKQHELDLTERELDRQEGVLASQKDAYLSQGRRLAITLAEQNRIYQSLRGQLRREELARLFRVIGGGVRGQSVPLDFCPVAGPHSVSNSFGASRGGGSRRHQGNDIMAPHGAPIVAVVSGRVTRTGNGGLGGKSIYLSGNGVEFYYAHLSSISVGSGQSVSAGQRLGGNGNSGNARGGPSHLHFEIHPGGGRAIDPYPSLARVC
ncbi:MAG: murein hydrolase activator EnvC family protein [Actinomycetota bacterium]